MSNNKFYHFYSVLTFIQKKWKVLILFPILGAVLALGISLVIPNKGDYIGTSLMYTGSINVDSFTNPEHVQAKYAKNTSNVTSSFFVSGRKYVEAKFYGDSKDSVSKVLEDYNKLLLGDMMLEYDKRKGVTEESVVTLQQNIEDLSKSLESYNKFLDESSDVTSLMEYTPLIAQTQEQYSEKVASLQRMKNDLAFFESPALVTESISERDKNYLEFAIAGAILGFIFALLILFLWKGIVDARKEIESND